MRPDIVLEFVFFIISNQKIFHIYFFWICHLFLFIKLRFIYLLNLLNLLNKQTLVLRLVRIVDLQHHTLQITLFFFVFLTSIWNHRENLMFFLSVFHFCIVQIKTCTHPCGHHSHMFCRMFLQTCTCSTCSLCSRCSQDSLAFNSESNMTHNVLSSVWCGCALAPLSGQNNWERHVEVLLLWCCLK